MIKKLAGCIILIGLTFSNAALAFRCGRELVTVGDYKVAVYDKCGQPESIETHREFVSQSHNAKIRSRNFTSGMGRQHTQEIKVEIWIYNFGPSRFKRYLRFENGRLVYIEPLKRGN